LFRIDKEIEAYCSLTGAKLFQNWFEFVPKWLNSNRSPHLLESFTESFAPLTPAEREHFLGGIAILEAPNSTPA